MPSLVIGTLMGATGIGGVLLVPTMSVLGDLPLRDAIVLCMWIYVLSGAVATGVFARHAAVDWPRAFQLSLGAGPGALGGAALLGTLPEAGLRILIGGAVLLAALQTLSPPPIGAVSRPAPAGAALVLVGALTGLGSALTGTGGPIILLPTLLLLRYEPRRALGLAQAIQVPIGLVATIGNLVFGRVYLLLGSFLGIAVVSGVMLGAVLANHLPVRVLRIGLSVALLVVGVLLVVGP